MTPRNRAAATAVAADMPRRQASRPLVDFIGDMTDEQAARAIAILGRHLYAQDATAQTDTSDAA